MDRTVGRFGSRTEAEMARRLLDDAGIPARIRADDVGAMHPELGQVGNRHGITLVVPAEHVAEAEAFLAATAAGHDPLWEDGADAWEEPDRSRQGLRIAFVGLLMLAIAIGVGTEFFAAIGRFFGG